MSSFNLEEPGRLFGPTPGFRLHKLETANTAAEATLVMQEEAYPFLEEHELEALGNTGLTLDNGKTLERDYLDWIEKERDTLIDEMGRLKNRLVKAMQAYNNRYTEETREIDSDLESLPEYARMLEQLQSDGLPAFEQRFKQLLHENAINQIALFQAKLKQAHSPTILPPLEVLLFRKEMWHIQHTSILRSLFPVVSSHWMI